MNLIDKLSALIRSRLFQNILFWAVSFLILLSFFSRTGEPRLIDVIYTFLFHLPLLMAVCVNSFVLIPKFLSKERKSLYLFLIILLIPLVYLGYQLTFNILADWIFSGFYLVAIYTFPEIAGITIIYLGITSLLEFSKSWFREVEIKEELNEIKREQAETELKALRAQINPHFLFNSLNHVYSLAVKQSPKTAPAILQLSDLLRYTIRNVNVTKVALEQEIEYIKTYTELFKNRVKHAERIHFQQQGKSDNLKIAPLLLLTFIENCFKHGSLKQEDEKIDISIEIDGGNLTLRTENSIEDFSTTELPEESSKLGLENARKRLKLLYPDRHSLDITTEHNLFKLSLTLNLV